jgi:protein gp37
MSKNAFNFPTFCGLLFPHTYREAAQFESCKVRLPRIVLRKNRWMRSNRMENSNIEWCDHTFNPWMGCQKVSPGCDHCYAEAMMDTRYGRVQWGPHGERVRTSQNNWRMPLRWAKKANGDRPRVFCASLADWLDNRAPREWRSDLGRVIEATPELDWLLLTKRPENLEKLAPWHLDEIPSNVWLGVTCEDQAHYERRWAIFSRQRIRATTKFVSYEPALGPLTLQRKWSDTVPD